MQTMMMLMLAGLLAFCPSALSAPPGGRGTQKAQESKANAPPQTQLRVFRLKHAACENIAGLLERMPLHVTAQYDKATDSVICVGMEANLQLCEGLIGELDIAVEGAEPYVPTKTLIRVFRLKNASCRDVVKTINSLVTKKVRAEERINSIIYVGPENNLEALEAIEKIIKELDSVPTELREETEVTVVPVKYRNVRDVAAEIRDAFPTGRPIEHMLHLTVDRTTSSILLVGPEHHVKRAETAIRQLDTPAAVRNLEFAFLRAESGGTQTESEIPDDLKEVANELKRFGQIVLIGRLSTIAVEGKPFSISGEKGMSYWIKGELLHASEDGAVKVEIEAQLNQYLGFNRGKPGRRAYNTVFKLETSVLTRRGDYVVLGSAPGLGAGESGESVILVLHVPR